MVNWLAAQLPLIVIWLQAKEPLFKRLNPQMRVKVAAALTALVILALLLMILAWLGARATRSYMRMGWKETPSPESKPRQAETEDWAKKPLDNGGR